LYASSIEFIGMSGVPPVTGPITFGTATDRFNGRVGAGPVGAVVGVGEASLLDDEHAVGTTNANALAVAISSRALTVDSPCLDSGRGG
jgi:hypothetical protein